MTHEHILVNILQVNDVWMIAGPPVKINLTSGLGHVTKNLKEHESGNIDESPHNKEHVEQSGMQLWTSKQ